MLMAGWARPPGLPDGLARGAESGAVAGAAHPNSLANLCPWTDADRAQRGHPKRVTLLQHLRAPTPDGTQRADFMLRVLRGEPVLRPDVNKGKRYPSIRLRMQAADWLTTRAFGRPPSTRSNKRSG
jgi:hypothetical protein